MKKLLFITLLMMTVGVIHSQSTYYWVGGIANSTTGINTLTNWNTALDGSGSPRADNNSGNTDILVFDATNLGGSAPETGPAVISANSSVNCGQMIFVNNVNVTMLRPTSGTSTITLNGGSGEDFVVNAGSSFIVNSPAGSLRFTISSSVDNCRVSGIMSLNTSQQMSFRNGTSGAPGTFHFTSGSKFYTNITSSSSSYAFGSSSQSSSGWVVFESGSELFYQGGFSPEGSGTSFSAITMEPGSIWHHQADNAGAGGNFFNKHNYGDVIVENNSTVTAGGTIFRIGNLTVNSGSTFTTHTSGQTAIVDNLIVNGTLNADPASTNEIVFSGNGPQTISGTGTINVPGIVVGNEAALTLGRDISVSDAVTVYGKINFADKQVTSAVSFDAKAAAAPIIGAGTTVSGSNIITAISGIGTDAVGQLISGAGIPANTTIVSVSVADDQVGLSNPATADAVAVALTIMSEGATLQTANSNGFNPVTGSVIVSGSMVFEDGINYIIDAATSWPFGITTGAGSSMINTGTVDVNANITLNSSFSVNNNLFINGKLLLRPTDTVHILTGGNITGAFGNTKYIATDYSSGTGEQSTVLFDGITSPQIIPIGTTNYYLPVSIYPNSVSNYSVSVFEGITINGTITGTPFTPTQKLRVVNAVWNVDRLSGTGDAGVTLHWDAALEGSTFSTLADTAIGIIRHNGTIWGSPLDTGNNVVDTAYAMLSSFGKLGIGAIPQVNAFVFNALQDKTYGDADFNAGATSLNTTNPIIYTSSNPAVATIVNGDIHITGAGTTDITATQMGDGVFPDTSATRSLLVNKTNLTIKADDKLKFEGLPNPTLTMTYTGFVLGETESVLLTPAVISTTADATSVPGTYPITVNGATSNNYNISFVDGVLTIQAKTNQTITFNQPATKAYGNADFTTGATSTNSTIPITYTSSNTSVATVSGNTIHITGAGTTTITAMQVGNDGYFPAPNVARVLTVNKVSLIVKALDTTKIAGEPNPVFIIVYNGFVLGETPAALTEQPSVTTSAIINSSPGYYVLAPNGGVSQNYNFNYQAGRLTILPITGTNNQYLNVFFNGSSSLIVRVYSAEPALADISVYDINGKRIAGKNILMPVGFGNINIQLPFIQSGLYVVTVRGNGVKLQKIIQVLK